jgi:tetratricopeptide (TPR) repeat protein
MQGSAKQISDQCRQGMEDLGAGRLAQARARFGEVISVFPDFAPALHALAVIARQHGRLDDALAYATRAEAASPGAAQAMVLRARILVDLGRLTEAASSYRRALAVDEADPQTLREWAQLAERLGDHAAAMNAYHAVLARRPADASARRKMVTLLRGAGRLGEAEQLCQLRLRQASNDAEAWFDLGNVLYDAEQFDGAAIAFRTALHHQPDHADAMENLGNTLLELGDLAPAAACLRQARAWQPQRAGPHNGLGAVLRQAGHIAEAEACFRAALAQDATDVEASCNLATTLLLTGRMQEGWRLFESRWGTAKLPNRGFAAPLWNGEALGGGTLLLHGEQGLGDTLQFCRFIGQVKSGRVIVEVPAPLVRLIQQSFPAVAEFVAYGQTLPEFQAHCPLMSLPLALGIEGTSFSPTPSYLVADATERASWRARLAALPGLRVGLVWQGNPRIASMRRRRDLPSHHLAALAKLPGISFVSLQKMKSSEPLGLPMVDWTDEWTDFAATAALIAELDLVIGVDTSVVHLAGGLGRPVWLLNRFDTCWRWMTDRTDSPWYPTLRQFRQPAPGDWDSVMGDVVENLKAVSQADP